MTRVPPVRHLARQVLLAVLVVRSQARRVIVQVLKVQNRVSAARAVHPAVLSVLLVVQVALAANLASQVRVRVPVPARAQSAPVLQAPPVPVRVRRVPVAVPAVPARLAVRATALLQVSPARAVSLARAVRAAVRVPAPQARSAHPVHLRHQSAL